MIKVEQLKDWKEGINQVVMGDCLEMMKLMPDKCIDLVVTDPPYGIGEKKIQNNDLNSKYGMVGKRHKHFEWDEKRLTENYFKEIFRVSKNQIIWGGNYYADYLGNSRCWIVWDKMNDKFYSTSDGELAWTSFESRLRFFRRPHGLDKGFMVKNDIGNGHPTQKPKELMKFCIENYSETTDLIFDPFMGSWTTARACIDLKRNFLGTELSEEYCKIGENRLRQQVLL